MIKYFWVRVLSNAVDQTKNTTLKIYVAHDSNFSTIKMPSANEIMQLVFDNLQSNRPKPLKSCYLHCLPVHKRFISLPDMAVLTNSAVEWKSMTDITLTNNFRIQSIRDRVEIHAECDVTGSGRSPENIKKPSENCYFQCLPAHKRSLSLPDVALRATPAGDAPEIGVSSVASMELPVSLDSSCTESYVVTSMPPAATAEDIGIETPLSVSSSPVLVKKVEAGVRIMVTDPVTRDGRSDEETDPAASCSTVTFRRQRRSLFSRTKKFVRRMFCCDAIDHADL
ncbi:hypothetical protein QTP88_002662 [Uroleucon formosanum]